MIRKLEYLDKEGNLASFSYEIDNLPSGMAHNVDLHYLEDSDYLFNPTNGYVDDSGNATDKLIAMLKRIEEVNAGTWEYVVSNVSFLDKRPLRGGRTRSIQTIYDQSGEVRDLITGIGYGDDCNILKVDQETEPDIMSKDLFISTMEGYAIGPSAGHVADIDYSNILNPVNQDNVNNYYPVVNHGYLYNGETEYYMYGNKQTEIMAGELAEWDENGYVHFYLSGQPNIVAPIATNIQDVSVLDLIANVNISDYEVYANNSYRSSYNGQSAIFDHDLATLYPWVYISNSDTNEIVLPDVEILTLNKINVSTTDSVTGFVNVIRPNKYTRIFEINSPNNYLITHNLNSTDIFAVVNTGSEIGIPTMSIVDENNVRITAIGWYGNMLLIDMAEFSYQEDVTGFSSGNITHNMDLLIESTDDMYVDPWVFAVPSGGTVEPVISYVEMVDKDTMYLNFGGTPFTGTINMLDFVKLNEAGALQEGTAKINTDYFAFEDGEYFGNIGLASPFHITHPLPSNQRIVTCLDKHEEIRELSFISGYYDGSTYPDEPVYITPTNEIVIPSGMAVNDAGLPMNLIVNYERDKVGAYEFRFRGTDVSPVSWYNTDRVIAIQIDQATPYKVEVIPDENDVRLQDAATRVTNSVVTQQDIEAVSGNIVYGEPITNINTSVLVTDEAGTALSGQAVCLDTRRHLYREYNGETVDIPGGYDIQVVDNTEELFALPSGIISTYLSGETISTPSIFDEVIFNVTPELAFHVFDRNTYLFTTMPGMSSYRIPFVGSLYDEDDDELTHVIYKETDVFGTCANKVGFHNNPMVDKISNLDISAYISGNTSVRGETNIRVYPINEAETYGTVDDEYAPNPFTQSVPIQSESVSFISGTVTNFSSVGIVGVEPFNYTSGIVHRDYNDTGVADTPTTSEDGIVLYNGAVSGILHTHFAGNDIIDIFQIDNKYMVHHESSTDGDMILYDEIDSSPATTDVGEYYGSN